MYSIVSRQPWTWCGCSRHSADSNSLGPLSPEKTTGSQHQHDQKQHITRNVAKPSTKARVEVPRSQALEHSDDHCTDDAARHAVEAADDDNRKHLETNQCDPKAAAR